MEDKYLSPQLLEDYHRKAKEELKQTFQKSTNNKPSKKQESHLEEETKKLHEAYDKIKSRNEENKNLRSVHSKKPSCLIL